MHVVIVGASVAGIRTVQALRHRGFTGQITVIGDEVHPPYDKPPLSKQMLDPTGDGSPIPLMDAEALAALSVELRLGVRATGLDTADKVVHTDAGDIAYDKLVIATGVSPRTLPDADRFPNVYTVRTADDALALRKELVPGRRVVVIGAGFIGAEFASAATAHALGVTMVEAQIAPLAQQLGAPVGLALAELHAINNVQLLTGVRFSGFDGEDRATGVRLEDGRVLPADFVVVGIGAQPAVDWLGSSVTIDNGVVCDGSLRAIGTADVYAAGDVAHWHHPVYDEPMRIEHWTNANDHAEIIAADLLDGPPPRPTVPYVWSDQYGKRIQIVGRPARGTPTIQHGSSAGGDLVVGFTDDDTTLVGALTVDNPRLLMKLRKAILTGNTQEQVEQTILAGVPASK